MRKNHLPYWLYLIGQRWNKHYIRRVLKPQFDHIGNGLAVHKPRHLHLFGENIRAGRHLHIICSAAQPVNLSCWSSKQSSGRIDIGNHVLISPGVKISSIESICIEDNCMIAAEVYISDSDWHGVYNRTRPFRCSKKIVLKENCWIGFRAIIGKGVSIGKNSIIGAGSVVISDIPDNVIAAGNPAKIVKTIQTGKRMLTREFLFNSNTDYEENQKKLQQYLLNTNSTSQWLRSHFLPTKTD